MTAAAALWLAAAFAAGALVAWAVLALRRGRDAERLTAERERRRDLETSLQRERQAAAEANRRLAVAEERSARGRDQLEEQKAFVERAGRELEDAFRALAASALQGTTEQFLALAEQRLAAGGAAAARELDERKAGVAALLAPLQETLQQLQQRTAEIERSRIDAYSRLDEQVRALLQATDVLRDKTVSLETALRGSPPRGRWGEIALRNIVELAGLTEHCDFVEQQGQEDGGRPDMVVNLPGGRRMAVDAKAPVNAFLDASGAPTAEARFEALARHAAALRQHVRGLERREYARALGGGIDLVIMFLPGDPFLAAACEAEPDLQTDAIARGVLIATPTTLVALLRNAALFWQQQSLADNAREIAQTALTLYRRVAVFREHLEGMGIHLQKTLDAFNSAVGSFHARLLPLAGKLEDLKVAEQEMRAVKELRQVEGTPRLVGD
jgi:DNA recombination protein RmuC